MMEARAVPRGRYVVLFVVLLTFSHRVVNSWSVDLGGLGDLQISQVVLVVLLAIVGLSRGAFWVGPTVRALFFLVSMIIVFNMWHMATNQAKAGPLLSGMFNATLFFCAALLLHQAIGRYWDVRKLALTVTLLGATLALSVLIERVLLELAPSLYAAYIGFLRQRVLLGESVDPNQTRMMGLMGSPEVTGFGIALTLPFVPLASLSARGHGCLLFLYTVAAVLTGTRTFGVPLVLYAILMTRSRYRAHRNQARALLGMTLVLSVVVLGLSLSSGGDTYGLLSRYSFEAFARNLIFRTIVVKHIVEALNQTQWGWIMGLGLGLGVENLYGFTGLSHGILGGDLVMAFGFGGILGLGLLIGMWVFLLDLRRQMRRVGSTQLLAINVFLLIVGLNSLIVPTLFGFLFGFRSLFSFLPILFVLVAEALLRQTDPTELRENVSGSP